LFGHHEWLVESDPVSDPIAESTNYHLDVLSEPRRHVAIRPSSAALQGSWKVPVMEGKKRLYVGGQQLIEQPVIEVETLSVHYTYALGKNSRPTDRESVRAESQFAHQGYVVVAAVVVITGDVTVISVVDGVGRMRELVPNATPGTVS
jgi:hypothetical protein